MCKCPDPKGCDICGSMNRVLENQGAHVCSKCLKEAMYASTQDIKR